MKSKILLLIFTIIFSLSSVAFADHRSPRDNGRSYKHYEQRNSKDYHKYNRGYNRYQPYKRMNPEYRRGDRTYRRGYGYWHNSRYHRYMGHYPRRDWFSGPRHSYPRGAYHYDAYNQLMFSFFNDGMWFSISIGD
jgi:hypothetical protein